MIELNTRGTRRPTNGGRLGWGLATSMFQRFYVGEYRSERYPTRDKVIPWKLFAVKMNHLWAILAQERLQMARSINLAFSSDKGEGHKMRREEIREAYQDG